MDGQAQTLLLALAPGKVSLTALKLTHPDVVSRPD